MRLLCSPPVSLPFLSHWGLYGKAICGASERAAQLPAPLRQRLTAETSEQAGGQDSPLSDGCFLLALIDQRQSPPTVCHISAKWITDKSAGADCSTDLTTSLRPQCSQVTSAWHCVAAAPMTIQASLKLWAAKNCIIMHTQTYNAKSYIHTLYMQQLLNDCHVIL